MAEILMTTQGFNTINSKVIQLAAALGIDANWLGNDQLRLLVADLIRYSPPRAGPVSGVTQTIDQKVGFARVEKDILKVITPMSAADVAGAREMGIGPYVGRFRFKSTKTGAVWLVDADSYMPGASMGRLARHHTRNRRKDGRVTEARGGSESGRNTKDIGRWKGVNKLHVDERTVTEYIKKRQKRVLRLASGWLPAFDQLNSKAGLKRIVIKKVPLAKIRKASGGLRGALTGGLRGLDGGQVTAHNRNSYASRKYAGMLPSLQRRRVADMNDKFEKRSANTIARFNRSGGL